MAGELKKSISFLFLFVVFVAFNEKASYSLGLKREGGSGMFIGSAIGFSAPVADSDYMEMMYGGLIITPLTLIFCGM